MAITPVFADAAADGAIPTDIDLIRLVLTDPPSPPDTINVPITPGQDSIRIVLPMILNGVTDTVGVEFLAIRSSDSTVLYSGTQRVAVTVGPPAAPTPIVASYVGPGKNIQSIAIEPPAVTLKPGGTQTFTTVALDPSGAAIIGMPVLFASRNRAVMTVNAAGEALAVAEGTTYVVATSGARSSIKDSARVAVSTTIVQPAIALSPASLTILDTVGTSDKAAQTVSVTNSGGGTLGGLTHGAISYGASQPTGWLTATLNGTTAPTTLTLQAAKGSLAAGTYTATVPVQSSAASNSPQSVSVTFQIAPAPSSGLASITVTPGFRVMLPGDTMTLQVAGKDGSGNPVAVPGLSFVSRYPSVATVNAASGLVTAVGLTNVVIVAQAPSGAGTVADSVMVDVPPTGTSVVSAQFGTREFAVAKLGDTIVAQVVADLRAVPGEVLGSYDITLNFNTVDLAYVRSDTVAGGFAAPVINDTQASSGVLRFGSADPNGSASPVALFQITFVAKASGTTSQLLLTPSDLSAAKTFTNLLTQSWWTQGYITIR